jgi:chromosome segregation ATPase
LRGSSCRLYFKRRPVLHNRCNAATTLNPLYTSGMSSGVSVDEFQALEQKVLRAVEIVKREREARAVAEAEVASLRQQLAVQAEAAQSQIAAAQSKAEAAQSQIASAHSQAEAARSQATTVESQIQVAQSQAQAAQRDKAAAESQIAALIQERDAVRQRVERMMHQMDELL